jgi:hypothetical protein
VSKDFAAAAALLAPDVRVEVPINTYPTRESFVAALAEFAGMTQRVIVLDEFARETTAMLLYDMDVRGLGRLRVAEHFTVEGGVIQTLRQIHDTHAIREAGFARG